MLSDKAIQEFKQVIKKEHWKDLTDDEAKEYLASYVRYFQILNNIYQREKDNLISNDKLKKNK